MLNVCERIYLRTKTTREVDVENSSLINSNNGKTGVIKAIYSIIRITYLIELNKCLQLLGLHRSPCSKAQRDILSEPIEHDNVPSWFQITESLVSISTA